MEDIDPLCNMTTDEQRKAVTPSYAPTTAYTPKYNKCPSIYPSEIGCGASTSGTARSVQTSWVTGTTTFTSGAFTSYAYSISTYAADAKYYAMLTFQTGDTGSTSHKIYWVATRAVYIDNNWALFKVFVVTKGSVACMDLYRSSVGDVGNMSYCVRPVVEVNLNSYNIGITGSGTSDSPYSISKK